MNNTNRKPAFVIDVEADGGAVGLYSMISFGVVDLYDHSKTFFGQTAPLEGAWYNTKALEVCNVTRQEHESYPDPETTMVMFQRWLTENYNADRYIMWSDNPAWDFQWVNYYSIRYLGTNPFGHSARRIGDLSAGFNRKPTDTSSWKKLRDTKHTHHPVDDALGNAQALTKILERMKK